MTIYCKSCCNISLQQSSLPYLCESCFQEIDSLRYPNLLLYLNIDRKIMLPAVFLFSYQGLIRELVLSSKIKVCRQSADLLLRLMLEFLPAAFLSDVVAICPVPASLKSRLKGKFNLACFWGVALAKIYQLPLLSWRGQSFYSWKKRSLVSGAMRRQLVQQIAIQQGVSPESGNPKILIVDDVITSGYTIGSIVKDNPGYEYKLLTLATAMQKV